MPTAGAYKSSTDISVRKEYADRGGRQVVSVILECAPDAMSHALCPTVKRSKFPVPIWQSVSQFLGRIRQTMTLKSSVALFLFVGDGEIPRGSATFGEIYDEYRDMEDGILYIVYAAENTFGRVILVP